ncbi:MAG: hypothetical protein JXB07_14395 [Anaerolineae bacterium]|nr:hypothetical protein [Anaerolineae bacterium]
MLVIHWTRQNQTSAIKANGIHPTHRRDRITGKPKNIRGVYAYPFSRIRTLMGNWRRNLKTWDLKLGNYNGFVFRLAPEDFPLFAGYWFFNRSDPGEALIGSMEELAEKYGCFFSGEIVNMTEEGASYNWEDFEIIIPRRIEARRIIRILKDREPQSRAKSR